MSRTEGTVFRAGIGMSCGVWLVLSRARPVNETGKRDQKTSPLTKDLPPGVLCHSPVGREKPEKGRGKMVAENKGGLVATVLLAGLAQAEEFSLVLQGIRCRPQPRRSGEMV